MPHRDYSVSVGSDADTETDGIMSPEHAVRLWGRSNTKSGRSSCLSSRANSNLTLTDTEHENTENGRTSFCYSTQAVAVCLFPCWFDFCWNESVFFKYILLLLFMSLYTWAEQHAMSQYMQYTQSVAERTVEPKTAYLDLFSFWQCSSGIHTTTRWVASFLSWMHFDRLELFQTD